LRRIRVAFCIDSFAIGGTELNAVRTAEALDFRRIELHVFHLQNHGPLRTRYEQLGVPITHIPIPNLYSYRTAIQGLRLAAHLRHNRIDVVHSHDIYSNIFSVPWARMFTSCSIIASRRWWYEAPRPELVTVNRWSYKLAHRVLANSTGVSELLRREEKVAATKIVVIPNFLTEASFEVVSDAQRRHQQQAWGLPADAFVIGIVARLSPVKNHIQLLDAMTRLDHRAHLVVIGDGPSRSELEAAAQRLGIASRVHFTGEVVAPHNLHQYLDASVLCSSSEGFPNTVIEAMAAARPVIATPVGGVTDVVEDDITGQLVPVGDPAALADAVNRLMSDPALCRRHGDAGRESVRRTYQKDTVIASLTSLYESLADTPSGVLLRARK